MLGSDYSKEVSGIDFTKHRILVFRGEVRAGGVGWGWGEGGGEWGTEVERWEHQPQLRLLCGLCAAEKVWGGRVQDTSGPSPYVAVYLLSYWYLSAFKLRIYWSHKVPQDPSFHSTITLQPPHPPSAPPPLLPTPTLPLPPSTPKSASVVIVQDLDISYWWYYDWSILESSSH